MSAKSEADPFAGIIARGRPPSPLKVLVHGERGIGITTFLSQAPDVVFLSLDGGGSRIDAPQWQGEVTTLDILEETLRALGTRKHGYRSLAIEGVEQIEQLIIERIEQDLIDRAEETDGPTTFAEYNDEQRGGGWDLVRDRWLGLLRQLAELHRRGMNVLMSAPTSREPVARHDGSVFDRQKPAIKTQQCSNLLKGWFDHVLYIAEEEIGLEREHAAARCVHCAETIELKDEEAILPLAPCAVGVGGMHAWGARRMVTRESAGKSARFIHCTQTPWHDAKCRGGIEWPDRIVFDRAHGWQRFATTARLIFDHGQALGTFLREEGSKAIAKLGPAPHRDVDYTVRQANARRALEEAIDARDYVRAQQIIDYAQKSIEEERTS